MPTAASTLTSNEHLVADGMQIVWEIFTNNLHFYFETKYKVARAWI